MGTSLASAHLNVVASRNPLHWVSVVSGAAITGHGAARDTIRGRQRLLPTPATRAPAQRASSARSWVALGPRVALGADALGGEDLAESRGLQVLSARCGKPSARRPRSFVEAKTCRMAAHTWRTTRAAICPRSASDEELRDIVLRAQSGVGRSIRGGIGRSIRHDIP
jgi:hypothetical protein